MWWLVGKGAAVRLARLGVGVMVAGESGYTMKVFAGKKKGHATRQGSPAMKAVVVEKRDSQGSSDIKLKEISVF